MYRAHGKDWFALLFFLATPKHKLLFQKQLLRALGYQHMSLLAFYAVVHSVIRRSGKVGALKKGTTPDTLYIKIPGSCNL